MFALFMTGRHHDNGHTDFTKAGDTERMVNRMNMRSSLIGFQYATRKSEDIKAYSSDSKLSTGRTAGVQ